MTTDEGKKILKYCKENRGKVKGIRIDDMSWRGIDFYHIAIFAKDCWIGKKRYTSEMFIDLQKWSPEGAIKLFRKECAKSIKKVKDD